MTASYFPVLFIFHIFTTVQFRIRKKNLINMFKYHKDNHHIYQQRSSCLECLCSTLIYTAYYSQSRQHFSISALLWKRFVLQGAHHLTFKHITCMHYLL